MPPFPKETATACIRSGSWRFENYQRKADSSKGLALWVFIQKMPAFLRASLFHQYENYFLASAAGAAAAAAAVASAVSAAAAFAFDFVEIVKITVRSGEANSAPSNLRSFA